MTEKFDNLATIVAAYAGNSGRIQVEVWMTVELEKRLRAEILAEYQEKYAHNVLVHDRTTNNAASWCYANLPVSDWAMFNVNGDFTDSRFFFNSDDATAVEFKLRFG